MIPNNTIKDMRRQIADLERELARAADFRTLCAQWIEVAADLQENDDGPDRAILVDLRAATIAKLDGTQPTPGAYINLGIPVVDNLEIARREAVFHLTTARSDLAKARGRIEEMDSARISSENSYDEMMGAIVEIVRHAYDIDGSTTTVPKADIDALRDIASSPFTPEPETDGEGRTCGDDVTADDTRFLWPFGTVRACVDCGVLVSGGPTRCLRCAGIATKQRQQEPKGHGFAGVCRACGEVMQYDGSCPTCDDMERQDGGGDE